MSLVRAKLTKLLIFLETFNPDLKIKSFFLRKIIAFELILVSFCS